MDTAKKSAQVGCVFRQCKNEMYVPRYVRNARMLCWTAGATHPSTHPLIFHANTPVTTRRQLQPTMRHLPRQNWSCPDHIIEYVERSSSLGSQKAAVSSVEEVKSAQQLVYIITLRFDEAGGSCQEEASPPLHGSPNEASTPWQRTLCSGRNKIVARVWKGSARWWNLNTNDACTRRGVVNMARSEIAGYRMARAAISASHACADASKTSPENEMVVIPEVIYFSCDYRVDKTDNAKKTVDHRQQKEEELENPWAILSYVGDGSCYFQSGDKHSSRASAPSSSWVCDEQYAKDMVKIRHEFGFDEPHPRWGRVKEDQALNYAMRVMDSVVLPIQSAFFSSTADNTAMQGHEKDMAILGRPGNVKPTAFRYLDMVATYHEAANKMMETIQESDASDRKIRILLATLKACIECLDKESRECPFLSDSDGLPPSLCHCDLQPQNLILRRKKGDEYDVNVIPFVSSVLDWEEACYSDPRFEVLLMARKVCASRTQADRLWGHYSCQLRTRHNLFVGPIEPWLKLETVHSITTLLLQSMNLVGGGRYPWESKPDLLGKIEREFARLKMLGWDINT